jgi:type 1 glutamine amidotransferase
MRINLIPIACILLLFTITLTNSIPAVAKKKKKKGDKINVLLIDGQSKNHKHWKEWTPVLLMHLQESNLFQLDIATSPMKGESLDKFNPRFKKYDVIVTTYDGDIWHGRTQRNLENYIEGGGGMVVVHGADNAFPNWEAYNRMIGLGGWGERDEQAGPYVYIDQDGQIIRDTAPGPAGHHGPRHEFEVVNRAVQHPVMKDIPDTWLHCEDELYDMLRGPALDMEILATAYSSKEFEGTGRHEPVLMTITYGEGRIFHTTLGHSRQALSCVGFLTTFVRGCEWAAQCDVTFEIPDDFPTEKNTSLRTY